MQTTVLTGFFIAAIQRDPDSRQRQFHLHLPGCLPGPGFKEIHARALGHISAHLVQVTGGGLQPGGMYGLAAKRENLPADGNSFMFHHQAAGNVIIRPAHQPPFVGGVIHSEGCLADGGFRRRFCFRAHGQAALPGNPHASEDEGEQYCKGKPSPQ